MDCLGVVALLFSWVERVSKWGRVVRVLVCAFPALFCADRGCCLWDVLLEGKLGRGSLMRNVQVLRKGRRGKL